MADHSVETPRRSELSIAKADGSLDGPQALLHEIGSTGLRRGGGIILEEFLPKLQGIQGRTVYREMSDNDPVVGAMNTTIDLTMRQVHWSCEPADETPQAQEIADFVWQCFEDMEDTFPDILSSAMSFLPFGWSWLEETFKYRKGDQGGSLLDGTPVASSKFSDGRFGWRNLSIRAQDSLVSWQYDPTDTYVVGFNQSDPVKGGAMIPLMKSLHFRTSALKNNPEGRALDPATPVPTPSGWTTMADLETGDQVFDEAGRVRYVTAVANWDARPRYRLTFSDGSTIDADAAHEWATTKVHERALGQAPRLRTTEQIAATVKNSGGVSNHGIAWAGPLDYPAQDHLIDPWVLGLWLGDGTTLQGSISCHAQDAEETARLIEAAGYPTKIIDNGPDGCLGRLVKVYGGFQTQLRVLGLLGDKHVPESYLRGSIEQRRRLLAGLMDSDGTVDKDGRCEFTNTNVGLVDAVTALARSLGVGVRQSLRKRANGTSHMQDSHCSKFTPEFVPFELSRKRARGINQRARKHHYIVSVEALPPGPTRCIEVDGPSHLFLAGESLVASHNSILRTAYRPWWYKRRIEEYEAIGVERDMAGIPMIGAPPELWSENATTDEKKLLEMFFQLATEVRRNENEGIVFPLDYLEGTTGPTPQKKYTFELLSSQARRLYDTSAIIARYDQRIVMTGMADFILLGHEGTAGGLGVTIGQTKVDLFTAALDAWLHQITAEFNSTAIPRLLKYNGLPVELSPKLKHGAVQGADLAALGAFVKNLADSGFAFAGFEKLLRHLFGLADLPTDDLDNLAPIGAMAAMGAP